MIEKKFTDDSIPYFAWDRPLTVKQIKNMLQNGTDQEKQKISAWILREAAVEDVWQFLTPSQVDRLLPVIKNQLGRQKDFWLYIIRKWHELGKI
jgi:hypothetical protein